VSEHLHDRVGCKTVFATHYHELTQLADELVAVRNYNVAVREVGDEVLFLHKLQPGGADRSYGIEVGRLAGLPEPVLRRARQVLRLLEGGHLVKQGSGGRVQGSEQLGLFGPSTPHPVVEKLKGMDVDDLTPRQALELLARLAEEARE
jgi:DNA mismatch repair protein MutS